MDARDLPMETPYGSYQAFPVLTHEEQVHLIDVLVDTPRRIEHESLRGTVDIVALRLERMAAFSIFVTAFTVSEEMSGTFMLLCPDRIG